MAAKTKVAEKKAPKATEEEVVPAVKHKVPAPGTRVKIVEFLTGTESGVEDGTRGTVYTADEDTGKVEIFTDNAKLVTLVAGLDVWRKIPAPKA